jgi:hypothetical protein
MGTMPTSCFSFAIQNATFREKPNACRVTADLVWSAGLKQLGDDIL